MELPFNLGELRFDLVSASVVVTPCADFPVSDRTATPTTPIPTQRDEQTTRCGPQSDSYRLNQEVKPSG